jgi:predicted DNA-binding protein (MmcQ/YjbR family)
MNANPIYSMPPAAAMLAKLRKVCATLRDAAETVTFGHATFQVNGKTFAVFEQYKGEFGLALKVEKELQQVFLKDRRFYRTPYIGKHGWVTLRMESNTVDWKEVREMIRGSYSLIALKKSDQYAFDQAAGCWTPLAEHHLQENIGPGT